MNEQRAARDITDVLADLAANLRGSRASKGWSQRRLQKEAGVTQKHLSRLERQENGNTSLSTLCKLAGALDVEPVALLTPRPDIKRSHER
jgi:transcriptional regulator with XRE-family HTH domain